MAYKKILVDNLTCKRRFHISFDDEAPTVPKVEIKCLHCDAVVFRRENHAPAKLARDEVLIKLTDLSPIRTTECYFQDRFSPASKPKV